MQKKNLKQLAKIYNETYEKFKIGEHWNTKTANKLLSYWFNKQPDLAFVAEYNNQIVGGIIAGIKPWWDGNHLIDGEIFVHPTYQKRGIGKELAIELYKKALKKYKVIKFDTYTFKKTKFPLNWYKSQGFSENKDWTMISGNVKSMLSNLQGTK